MPWRPPSRGQGTFGLFTNHEAPADPSESVESESPVLFFCFLRRISCISSSNRSRDLISSIIGPALGKKPICRAKMTKNQTIAMITLSTQLTATAKMTATTRTQRIAESIPPKISLSIRAEIYSVHRAKICQLDGKINRSSRYQTRQPIKPSTNAATKCRKFMTFRGC